MATVDLDRRVPAKPRKGRRKAAAEPIGEGALETAMPSRPDAPPRAAVPDKQHIEELLKTGNEAASSARTAWLGFLGILAYLLVTIASTTHVDLLLNNPVTLPILNIKLPLFSFYGYAPVLLLLLHLGLLVQHAVVARKLHDLDDALDAYAAAHEGAESYVRGIRSRLTDYVFAQVLVGPYRELGFLAVLMRIMIWMSLIILPVLTFLAFQITFLPYHDMSEWPDGGLPRVGLTWWHRILLIADLALLWGLWPNIRQGNISWRNAITRYPQPFMVGNTVAAGFAVLFSIFVATIPDEKTDRWTANLPAFALSETEDGRSVFASTAWLLEGEADDKTLAPKSPLSRNLVVIEQDAVPDKEKWEEGERSLKLRNRNLRYANLRGTDLKRSNLAHAKLKGADLTGAQLQGADLIGAELKGAVLRRAQLQGADLDGAQLQGADLFGAQLQGANLNVAQLEGADLTEAQLQGAGLTFANIWLATHPDSDDALEATEMRVLRLEPLSTEEKTELKQSIETQVSVRDRVLARLRPVLSDEPPPWEDAQRWAEIAGRPPQPAEKIGEYLADLACGDADGHVTKGLARQAQTDWGFGRPPDVRMATAKAMLSRKAEDCPGRAHLSKRTLAELRKVAGLWPAVAEYP